MNYPSAELRDIETKISSNIVIPARPESSSGGLPILLGESARADKRE
jgi:hypothetical protein